MSLSRNFGIIIVCRDNSTRYKHKSVRPFHDGKSILEILIDRFSIYGYPIIVATTMNSIKTAEICKRLKKPHPYIMVPNDNVAYRLLVVATIFELDGFFRVNADNPFTSLGLMYPVKVWAETMDYDYVAFDNCMRRHEGFFLQFIKTNALSRMLLDTNKKEDREHVTPYIVRHPEIFKQKILPIPPIMDTVSVRLTVDTESDFKIAKKVYKYIGEKHWFNALNYISQNKKIEEKMLKNIKRNPKLCQ